MAREAMGLGLGVMPLVKSMLSGGKENGHPPDETAK